MYNVDLKKIMGVNVAFDISDNTDDIEPMQNLNSQKFGLPILPDPGNRTGSMNRRYSQVNMAQSPDNRSPVAGG